MHEVWSRVREGRHVVVVGAPPPPPETLEGESRWVVVRVSCDGPWSTWGPLEDGRRRIEALLGEQSPRWDEALDRMGTSTRFLGDLPEPTIEATLVSAGNRLEEQQPHRAALVIEALEHADPATIQALRDILGREGWLRLPLVLAIDQRPNDGPLAELLAMVEGDPITAPPLAKASGFDWASLAPEMLLVMRAAAVVGRSFDVDVVASLLGITPDAVLVTLQQAADLGVPLADHGGGRFFIPEVAQRTLVQRVLPSLVERWHRRLGEILATSTAASKESATDEDPAKGEAEEAAADESQADDSASYEEVLEPAGEDRLAAEARTPPPQEAPAVEEDDAEAGDTSRTFRLDPEQAKRLIHGRSVAGPGTPEGEGLPERAVEQYLAALRKVASRGDSRRALMIADQALGLLERQPATRDRDVMRARVMAMAARVQWRGAGRGASLTLQGALETLDVAEEVLPEDAPLDLRTEIASLVAGVCYDLGDISSLQRALDSLTEASRTLMSAGESVRAARLLNDQAAIYLRAGDPVRANHLLQQSRTIFDDLHRDRPDDPTVIVERAETEHLLARLPLHARLREGREDDAFSLALGHARAAAEGYRHLGGRVELGRVLETMGRLETARGRFEPAAEHLGVALRISRQLGDMTGLARSTAGLANLYIAAGEPAQALRSLKESIAFNVDKGSPLGLAVNRRTMDQLREAIDSDSKSPPALREAVREADAMLSKAESMLGRVSVPGDVD